MHKVVINASPAEGEEREVVVEMTKAEQQAFLAQQAIDQAAIEAMPKGLVNYQAERRQLYRDRILEMKGAQGASDIDAIGFVLDAVVLALVGGDDTELKAIAGEIAKVKAEVPKA